MNTPTNTFSNQSRKRIGAILFILALALTVRVLTANFLRAHFDDPGWFQYGSYAVFDRQAQDIMDGRQSGFRIPDATRTDLAVYPPGYPLWMASIYKITGDRSPASIQRVQLVLDSLSILLVIAIGVSAYSWAVGLWAGALGALSPLLAMYGAMPSADAPTSWLILAGVLAFVLCAKRQSVRWGVLAGLFLGLACWLRVNPLLLFVAWGVAVFVFLRANKLRRVALAASFSLTALLVISPVMIRNLIVFYPEVAPTGLGVGWNLWAGIGETERGPEFGAPCCDADMIEQDRKAFGLSADAPLALHYPNGFQRDRERGRKALNVIKSHPFWYSGVMAKRLWGNLKFAGKPRPSVGSAGFNVTSKKCLSPESQTAALSLPVNLLGMVQSVLRYIALPLMLVGVFLGFRRDRVTTGILMATVVYYLGTLAIAHSEIRYGLPMQALLFVFAGVTMEAIIKRLQRLRNRSTAVEAQT